MSAARRFHRYKRGSLSITTSFPSACPSLFCIRLVHTRKPDTFKMGELPQRFKQSLESTKAEYKQLGKSGLRVSVPILGAMSFGSKSWQPWVLEEDQVRLPIRRWGITNGADVNFRLSQSSKLRTKKGSIP